MVIDSRSPKTKRPKKVCHSKPKYTSRVSYIYPLGGPGIAPSLWEAPEIGVLLVVLIKGALLFGVYIRVPKCFLKCCLLGSLFWATTLRTLGVQTFGSSHIPESNRRLAKHSLSSARLKAELPARGKSPSELWGR